MSKTDKTKDTNLEQRIFEVAERLFIDKGFDATSTTEIAKEVGCNQALVHYYYRTKLQLFEAVFDEKLKILSNILLTIDKTEVSFIEKIRRFVEWQCDMLTKDPKIALFIIHEITMKPERFVRVQEKIGKLLQITCEKTRKELEFEIQQGNIRSVTFEDLILTIISLNMFLFVAKPLVEALSQECNTSFDELLQHRRDENVTVILNSLRP